LTNHPIWKYITYLSTVNERVEDGSLIRRDNTETTGFDSLCLF